MPWPIYDRQLEHWALIRREDRLNTRLGIFVHGFRGSYLSTWGQLSDFLRAEAGHDAVLQNWDYLFVGYETSSIGNYLNIARLIRDKWERASNGRDPFQPNRYEEVALFGHSLGTLGIRQLLCLEALDPNGISTALRAVVLFGSPLNGSPLARFAVLAMFDGARRRNFRSLHPGSYAIGESLKPNGAPLAMLHAWNEALRSQRKMIEVNVVLGTDDLVVGTGGLVSWAGDTTEKVALDHGQLCNVNYVPGQQPYGQLLGRLREHLQ